MTIETLKSSISSVTREYPIQKISLFGSRAEGTNRADSDVDLIIEFSEPVSLLTLSGLKIQLEEILGLGVDIIHGPVRKDDLIEVRKVVELYVAQGW